MGKKRDRTKEYHFKLVNRSMADPNHDMPDMGQHVLVPYVPENMRKKGIRELEEPGKKLGLDETVFGLHDNLGDDEKDRYRRRIFGLEDDDVDEVLPGGEEQEAIDGDCYFPADGYNYEKHLRAVSAAAPSSGVQMGSAPPGFDRSVPVDDTYLYGKQRDRMTREEHQIQDALDDDEDYEEADDDFFEELIDETVGDADALKPVLWGGPQYEAPAEVDEEFDALLDEYDDHLLGAQEDLPEGLDDGDCIEDYDDVLDDYIAKPVKAKAKNAAGLNKHLEEQDDDDDDTELPEDQQCRAGHGSRTLALVRDEPDCDDAALAKEFDRVTVEEDKYDCESVLSLRSNTSNHPGKIHRPEKPKKQKLEAVEEAEEEVVEMPEVQTLRPRDETAEDKKARKAAVKEYQRIARSMKKETKELYKQERCKLSGRVKEAGDLRDGVKRFAL